MTSGRWSVRQKDDVSVDLRRIPPTAGIRNPDIMRMNAPRSRPPVWRGVIPPVAVAAVAAYNDDWIFALCAIAMGIVVVGSIVWSRRRRDRESQARG